MPNLLVLRPADAGEVAECYDRRRHKKHMLVLCRQLARWTSDSAEAIGDCDPVLPSGVLNRQADKWRPLFAVTFYIKTVERIRTRIAACGTTTNFSSSNLISR